MRRTQSDNVVRFSGVLASVISVTANTPVVQVPAGAATGSITVSVGANSTASGTNFVIQPVR